jgi:hypothetical protein
VANNDSLAAAAAAAAAAKRAFHLISFLCPKVWSNIEPRIFPFFVFQALAGLTRLTLTLRPNVSYTFPERIADMCIQLCLMTSDVIFRMDKNDVP